MKAQLTLTAVILLGGSLWGWQETRTLRLLKTQREEVLQEASALGISTPDGANATTKASQRTREASALKVRALADELTAFAKEQKELEKTGKKPDEAKQKRIFELMATMQKLNADEMKMLLKEFAGRTDLDEQTRKEMGSFVYMMMAQAHPQTMLALYAENPKMLNDLRGGEYFLSSSISNWSKEQPQAALEWLKKNEAALTGNALLQAKRAILTGAAQKDVSLAFQLLGEMKLPADQTSSMMSVMANSANTAEKQTAFLNALRTEAGAMEDQKAGADMLNNGLAPLFSQVMRSGYDESTKWLSSQKLSDSEKKHFTESLNYYSTKEDTGKWMEWVGTQTLDEGTSENLVENLVRGWTRDDYAAAGTWLTQTPAGPVKETATVSYISAIAKYDSAVATQWAETLPEDKQMSAFKNIHRAIRSKDPTAAEAYAVEHGLK